ncbi:putative mitochondrial 2-oxodicarboxylate carrier [Diplonema papillatum]|nr:putative mitochondrial 2-oxodicarboxylate carrier [Diplonema papillatum]
MAPASKQSAWATLPPIGAASASVALLMYPADVMRALKMASAGGGESSAVALLTNFIKAHGVKGLASQGILPELLQRTWSRISKFFLFPVCHRALYNLEPSQGTPLTKGSAAMLATLPEMWTCTPFETAKVALQLDSTNRFKNSATNVVKWIYEVQGWKGLYCGYAGLQYRQAIWTSIYFATVDDITAKSRKGMTSAFGEGSLVNTSASVVGGFGAGMLGALINTPGDVVRTNVQKAEMAKWMKPPATGIPQYTFGPAYVMSGISVSVEMAKQITVASGVGGLWKGFGFKAVHLGGGGALLNLLVPFFKNAMGVTKE